MLSADAVYTLDYSAVVEQHLDSGADATMVTTRVDPQDAARYGVVDTDNHGRVTGYAYKPERPGGDLVSNEVFVFEPHRLLDLLEGEAGEAGEEGLRDLGHRVLPQLVRDGGGQEYRFEGYWQDVGTVDSYWSAHMDLLAADAPIRLDDPEWPIYTVGGTRGPARVFPGALVGDALLAPGVRGYGIVDKAVLGPGVTVKEGATVKDAVVLHETIIEPGATVERAVVDSGVRVLAGARVGGPHTRDAGNNGITLVGQGQTVPRGAQLLPGARYPDGQ